MAGDYIFVRRGDAFTFQPNVSQSGSAPNFVNANIWFQGWGNPIGNIDVRQLLINASTDDGQVSISGAGNNVVSVNINGATTQNYQSANVLQWALRAQFSNGYVATFDKGFGCIENSLIPEPYSS